MKTKLIKDIYVLLIAWEHFESGECEHYTLLLIEMKLVVIDDSWKFHVKMYGWWRLILNVVNDSNYAGT